VKLRLAVTNLRSSFQIDLNPAVLDYFDQKFAIAETRMLRHNTNNRNQLSNNFE
jgi:hypothetical protein